MSPSSQWLCAVAVIVSVTTSAEAQITSSEADAKSLSEYERMLVAADEAFDAGQSDEALAILEDALPLEPDDGRASFALACLWNWKGDDETALVCLEMAASRGYDETEAIDDEIGGRIRTDPRFVEALVRIEHNQRDRVFHDRGGMVEVHAARAEVDRLNALDAANQIVWQDGHGHSVLGARFSPDGERLLTWSEDGTVRMWDGFTGEHLALLTRHAVRLSEFSTHAENVFFEGAVGRFFSSFLTRMFDLEQRLSVSFDRDGERVLLVDHVSARAGLWDGRTGDFVAWLVSGESPVFDVAFRPDGRRVVTSTRSGEVLAWDAQDGHPVPHGVSRTDGGAHLEYSADGHHLLTLAADGVIRLWGPETGEPTGSFSVPGALLRQAFCSPSGRHVFARGGATWYVWSLDPERREDQVPRTRTLLNSEGTRNSPPRVASNADLALTSGVRGAVIWNLETGELQPVGSVDSPRYLSPDGERVILRGGPFSLWSIPEGDRISEFPAPSIPAAGSPITTLDGSSFVTGVTEGEVVVWDVRTGRTTATLEVSPKREVLENYNLAFSPAGDRLVMTARDSVLLWDVGASSRPLALTSSGRARALVTDGNLLCSLSQGIEEGQTVASLWSPRTGRSETRIETGASFAAMPPELRGDLVTAARPQSSLVLGRLSGRGGEELWSTELPMTGMFGMIPEGTLESSLAVSADGRRLLVADMNVWLLDSATGEVIRALATSENPLHLLLSSAKALSPDGVQAVVGSEHPGSILWSDERLAEEPVAMTAHADYVAFARFRSDGKRLVTTSYDGTAAVWDVDTRGVVHMLEGHGAPVLRADFSPDGSRLATVSEDGTTRLWDVENGVELHVLRGRDRESVEHIAFLPSGARLVTGSANGIVRVWEVASGRLVHEIEAHSAKIEQLFLDETGTRIFSNGRDYATRVWDADSGALLLTRVEYDGEDWIAFAPTGHYIGTPGAADVVRIEVKSGRTSRLRPLSSYATILNDPDRVAASLAGEELRRPFLPAPPEVDIDAPHSGKIERRAFRLKVTATDRAPIERLQVLRDGVEIDGGLVEAGLQLLSNGREARLSLPLEIPADRRTTEIAVRAWNNRGIASEIVRVRLVYEPPERDLYLLALGVEDYDDDALDLAYPGKDVEDLVARFEAEDGQLFSNVHVERLLDRKVTSSRIKRAREKFLRRAKPEDTIVVFVAGHGVRSESGDYYFLTPGATPEDPYEGIERPLLESLVTWDKLYAKRRLLLIDTCHSGEAYGEAKRGLAAQDAFEQTEVDAALGTGLYILAASSESSFALETEGNGLFTRAILAALDGGAPDRNDNGFIDVDELQSFVADFVHEESGGRQRPTVPRVEGGEGFPLARVP